MKRIHAIKYIRNKYNFGLKQAKDIVDDVFCFFNNEEPPDSLYSKKPDPNNGGPDPSDWWKP